MSAACRYAPRRSPVAVLARRGPGRGGGTRSPRRRQWSRWRWAGADGHVWSGTRSPRWRRRSRRRRAGADGHAPLTDQVKMAVGPIGPDHADLLRWVRIFKHTYTNPLANCMASCGLRGPLSAELGPCVDSCYRCIIFVWPTCHSRWNDRMGLKMGGQLDDPPDSQEGESRSQRTTFGGATPSQNP